MWEGRVCQCNPGRAIGSKQHTKAGSFQNLPGQGAYAFFVVNHKDRSPAATQWWIGLYLDRFVMLFCHRRPIDQNRSSDTGRGFDIDVSLVSADDSLYCG